MNIFQAILLGIIEGLTEFVPVSSTAHLLIGQKLLGLPSDEQIFAFQVIIQLGTILALLFFFWKDIWRITRAFFLGIWHRKPFETHDALLGWLLIVATIPALVFGFFMKDFIETLFADPLTQAGIRLLMSATLLGLVERFGRRNRDLESATWRDALAVGFFQVLALFPGASRSGTTIAGGMTLGLDRPSAARFAFLMSAPILLAAGAYETFRAVQLPGIHTFLPHLLTGFVTAAIVGWLSIKWLIGYLSKHSLYVFAVYCAILGALAFLLR